MQTLNRAWAHLLSGLATGSYFYAGIICGAVLDAIWRVASDGSGLDSRLVAPAVSGVVALALGLLMRRRQWPSRPSLLGGLRFLGACAFGLASPALLALFAIGGGPHMLEGVAPYLAYPAVPTFSGALLVLGAEFIDGKTPTLRG